MSKCTSLDPYIETLAADIDAVRGDLAALHSALYVEPGPRPHAVARCLVEVAEIRGRLATLAALVEGGGG